MRETHIVSTVLWFPTPVGGWENAVLTLIYCAKLIDARSQTNKRQHSFMLGNCRTTFHMISWIKQLGKFMEGKLTAGTIAKLTFWLGNFLSHKSLDNGKILWRGVTLFLSCSCIPLLTTLLPPGSWGRVLSYTVQLFSCTSKHKSNVLPLGEIIASVELGTPWEMSVILTFSEKRQLPCHRSCWAQWELEALYFLQIFSFWFWEEKCSSALTLEIFPSFPCKIIFSILHFNSLCVASDQVHSKVGIFVVLRQLVAQLGLWTGSHCSVPHRNLKESHEQSVTEGKKST